MKKLQENYCKCDEERDAAMQFVRRLLDEISYFQEFLSRDNIEENDWETKLKCILSDLQLIKKKDL